MQICCLIIAPVSRYPSFLVLRPFADTFSQAFFSAAIYLTLKHIVLTFGSGYSRLPPRWYTWIFIGCDLLSLILQGAGGGTAASANTQSTQDIGSNLMLVGIVWQVVTLLVFAALAGDFFLRAYRNRSNQTVTATEIGQTTKFMLFFIGLLVAYLTIETRCIYRIAELAGGWQNDIMQNETEFIILEGV